MERPIGQAYNCRLLAPFEYPLLLERGVALGFST